MGSSSSKQTYTLDINVESMVSSYRKAIRQLTEIGASANITRGLTRSLDQLENQYRALADQGNEGFTNSRELIKFQANMDKVLNKFRTFENRISTFSNNATNAFENLKTSADGIRNAFSKFKFDDLDDKVGQVLNAANKAREARSIVRNEIEQRRSNYEQASERVGYQSAMMEQTQQSMQANAARARAAISQLESRRSYTNSNGNNANIFNKNSTSDSLKNQILQEASLIVQSTADAEEAVRRFRAYVTENDLRSAFTGVTQNGIGGLEGLIVNITNASNAFHEARNQITADSETMSELIHGMGDLNLQLSVTKEDLEEIAHQDASGHWEANREIVDELTRSINNRNEAEDILTRSYDIEIDREDQLQNAINGTDEATQELNGTTDQAQQKFDQESDALVDTAQEAERTTKAFDNMRSKVLMLLSTTSVFNLIKKAVRDTYNDVKQLDKSFASIAMVTKYSVKDMWGSYSLYADMAAELGQQTNSIIQASALFYQQGLDTNEALELTTNTMKLATLAGNDFSTATQEMTSAIRGFKMEMGEGGRVTDVYSNLAAHAAATVDDIAQAMARTASIANSAGMTFENTSAFLAQMIETTQESAENIGTSLKTIIARFTELKENVAGTADSEFDDLEYNKVDKALKSVGVSIKDATGQFRNLDEVFLELSKKWDTLDRNTQRYVATIAAGSRQQSRFIAMMDNYERTAQLMEIAAESEGKADEQFAKYADTMEYKLNQLQTKWEEFRVMALNSDFFKSLIDGLNDFADRLKNVDFKKLLAVTPIAVWAAKTFVINFISTLKSLTSSISGAAKAIGQSIQNKLSKNDTAWSIRVKFDEKAAREQLELFNQRIEQQKQRYGNVEYNILVNSNNAETAIEELKRTYKDLDLSANEVSERLKALGFTESDIGSQTQDVNMIFHLLASTLENEDEVRIEELIDKFKRLSRAQEEIAQSTQLVAQRQQVFKTALNGIASSFAMAISSAISGITNLADTGKMLKRSLIALGVQMAIQGAALEINARLTGQKIGAALGNGINAGLASTGIGIAIAALGVAISGLFSFVDSLHQKYKNRYKTLEQEVKELQEAAEKANQEYNEAKNAAKESQESYDTAKKLKEEYEKLSNKLALTTEEQEKLKDITAQINETMPEIVESYNAQNGKLKVQYDLWQQILDVQEQSAQLNKEKELKAQGKYYSAEMEKEEKTSEKTVEDAIEELGLKNYYSLVAPVSDIEKSYEGSLKQILSQFGKDIELDENGQNRYLDSFKNNFGLKDNEDIMKFFANYANFDLEKLARYFGFYNLESMTSQDWNEFFEQITDQNNVKWDQIEKSGEKIKENEKKRLEEVNKYYSNAQTLARGKYYSSRYEVSENVGNLAAKAALLESKNSGKTGDDLDNWINETASQLIMQLPKEVQESLTNFDLKAKDLNEGEISTYIEKISKQINLAPDMDFAIQDYWHKFLEKEREERLNSLKESKEKLAQLIYGNNEDSTIKKYEDWGQESIDSFLKYLQNVADKSGNLIATTYGKSLTSLIDQFNIPPDKLQQIFSEIDLSKATAANFEEFKKNSIEKLKAMGISGAESFFSQWESIAENAGAIDITISNQAELDQYLDTLEQIQETAYGHKDTILDAITESAEQGEISLKNYLALEKAVKEMGGEISDYTEIQKNGKITLKNEEALDKLYFDQTSQIDEQLKKEKSKTEAEYESFKAKKGQLDLEYKTIKALNGNVKEIANAALAQNELNKSTYSYLRMLQKIDPSIDFDESILQLADVDNIKNDISTTAAEISKLQDEANKSYEEKDKQYREVLKQYDEEIGAQQKLSEAYKRDYELDKANRESSIKTTSKLAEAEDKYADALDKLQDAQEDVIDKQEKLNEKIKEYNDLLNGSENRKSSLDVLYNYDEAIKSFNDEVSRAKDLLSNSKSVEDSAAALQRYASATHSVIAEETAKQRILAAGLKNYADKIENGSYSYTNELTGKTTNINFGAYARKDERTGKYIIDQRLLNEAKFSDKFKDLLEEQVSTYNKYSEELLQSEDNVRKAEKELQDERNSARKNYVAMETEIAEALKNQYKNEVDALKGKYDAMKDADDDYIDALQDAIEKQRKLRDKEKAWDDLAQKEKKLSLMQRDTSGANELENRKLEQEIEEDRQDRLDDAIDSVIDGLSELYESQQELRDADIELKEALLENNAYWNSQAQNLAGTFTSAEEYAAFLAGLSEEYAQMTLTQQQDKLEEYKGTYTAASEYMVMQTMDAATESHDFILDTVKVSGEEINGIIKTTAETFTTEVTRAFNATAKEFTDEMNKASTSIKDAQKDLADAEKKVAEYAAEAKKANDELERLRKLQKSDEEEKEEKEEKTKIDLGSGAKIDLGNGGSRLYQLLNQKYGISNQELNAMNAIGQNGDANMLVKLLNVAGNKNGKFDYENLLAIISELDMTPYGFFNKYLGVNGLELREMTRNTKTPEEELKRIMVNTKSRFKFANGGLVDFTGPAWVDGTTEEPEAFLDADMTKRIGAAAKILSDIPWLDGYSDGSGTITNNGGDVNVEINLNIDHISSDTDIDEMLERVKEEIVEVARPQGTNVILTQQLN